MTAGFVRGVDWFFGHYHENMVIEKKYAMLYEQIIRLKL